MAGTNPGGSLHDQHGHDDDRSIREKRAGRDRCAAQPPALECLGDHQGRYRARTHARDKADRRAKNQKGHRSEVIFLYLPAVRVLERGKLTDFDVG